jgi:hypothetical protein
VDPGPLGGAGGGPSRRGELVAAGVSRLLVLARRAFATTTPTSPTGLIAVDCPARGREMLWPPAPTKCLGIRRRATCFLI